MRFKIDDEVIVVAGEDKGTKGTVQRILKKDNRIVISGVNVVKKHQKPRQTGGRQAQGGIIEFEAPISVSNVMLVCPQTGEPTRIGYRINDDGEKVRYSKKSGEDID